jgi:glutamate-1-semialdehyde 2,1-aminomutase
MIAGLTTLKILKENPQIYAELEQKTSYLKTGLQKVLNKKGFPFVINQCGSMISVHFTDHPVSDFATAAAADTARFKTFFHSLLGQGIYLPPSAFESWFLNNALTKRDLDETIEAVEQTD